MSSVVLGNEHFSNALFTNQLISTIGIQGPSKRVQEAVRFECGIPTTMHGMDGTLVSMNSPFLGQTDNITELYPVPENTVGLVIGRSGSEIQNIQSQSGCRVQMNPDADNTGFRQVTLQGMRPNLEKAKMMIQDVVMRAQQRQQLQNNFQVGDMSRTITIEIPIPANKCGLIIGKQGDTIRQLQESTGCKMIMIQDSQEVTGMAKPLRVTGEFEKLELAKRLVAELITKEELGPGQRLGLPMDTNITAKGEVIVPRSSVGMIIGKGGETIKRLAMETGTKIQFKPDDDPNSPERCALIMGTRDQIYRATELITELVKKSNVTGSQHQEVCYMHIPANKTGLVIGKGGDTIKQINSESGAHCELSRDPPPNPQEKVFMIRGTPQQIQNAQHIIRIKIGDVAINTPIPSVVGQHPAPQGNGNGVYGHAPQFNGQFVPQAQQPQSWNNFATAGASVPENNVWNQNQFFAGAQPSPGVAGQVQPQFQQPGNLPAVGGQFGQGQGTPAINPATGQADYSAQWAEYYRSVGLMEQAAMVESQMKQNVRAPGLAGGVASFNQYQNPNLVAPQVPAAQTFAQYQNNVGGNAFPQTGQFQSPTQPPQF